jgi:tripartite-type tricarboxylate transporter receptor subunit TctC
VLPIAETLPAFETLSWYGLFAPKRAPDAVVWKIYRDAKSALQSADLIDRYFGLGLFAVANTPDEFAAAIRDETAVWSNIAKDRAGQAR